MHDPREWIEREIKRCKNLRYRFTRRQNRHLEEKVSGRLTYSIKGGKKYYSEIISENGREKKHYLGSDDNSIVQTIQERRFLRKGIEILDERIDKLERSGEIFRAFDPIDINAAVPKAYRLSSDRIHDITGPDETERWYENAMRAKIKYEAEHGIWYEDGLRHSAKDGTRMRSKSEISIANEFISRGIPYIYEIPLRVGDYIMHPDFMFYSYSRGREMIWEHAGMLGDSKYMEDFCRKIDGYIYGGYIPGVDVIFSFDTTRGQLDTRIIDFIIDEYI